MVSKVGPSHICDCSLSLIAGLIRWESLQSFQGLVYTPEFWLEQLRLQRTGKEQIGVERRLQFGSLVANVHVTAVDETARADGRFPKC